MNGFPTRARRALRQRGIRAFLADSLVYAAERELVPLLDDRFASRALTGEDLAAICEAEDALFEYYDRGESYTFELPTTPSGYLGEVRERMLATYCSGVRIDPPYVCELSEVELVGPEAVVSTDGGYVFENSLESAKRLTTSCLRALAAGTIPGESGTTRGARAPRRTLDHAVSLVGPWNYNYTHWFQDYLPRLEGLEHYERATGTEPAVLIPADASEWMLDALRATGYGPDRWVEWAGGRVGVDRFVVSAVRREARERAPNRRIVYSPTGIEWLRERYADNLEPESTRPHSRRIYISRENALTRRVVNEEETTALLAEWGFERYRTEELSFAEQVTLFSDAGAIVAPHGSGLMNQIFADDATVIELFGPKQGITKPATEYYYAELLGHDYGCVQGETVGPDVRVDLDGLESLLETMLEP